ncbi:hypothetical protein MTR_6g045637 [Medicago truncatula]|uniref:Uncharacterized protein n=1 Tax=Medicago truncatula TaxID=3880 RepID=A0A072U9S0_MEDTR|nr:hypothetical protein MTR_6g045637 [Medicago truncatula]
MDELMSMILNMDQQFDAQDTQFRKMKASIQRVVMVGQGPKGKEGLFTSKGNRVIVSHQFKDLQSNLRNHFEQSQELLENQTMCSSMCSIFHYYFHQESTNFIEQNISHTHDCFAIKSEITLHSCFPKIFPLTHISCFPKSEPKAIDVNC